MSLHALVEKWRKEAAAYDAAYQCTASGWQPDWQSYGSALARERCADELEAALAGGGEAVAWQFQDRGGGWHNFLNDKHKDDTIADGSWPVRALFTHPAGAVQVTDELVSRAMTAHADEMERQDRAEALPLMDRLHECMRAALNAALNPGGSRE